jgi:hypothetical protein
VLIIPLKLFFSIHALNIHVLCYKQIQYYFSIFIKPQNESKEMENNNKVVLRNISIYTSLGLCNPSFCSKRCSDFMKVEKQQEINNKLLQSNDNQIRNFIIENVKKVETNKWDYYLEGLPVCCPMFCNTIGHKRPQNIQNFVLKSGIDKRYNNKSKHWKTYSNEFNNKIRNFLMSFKPQKSHYKLKS